MKKLVDGVNSVSNKDYHADATYLSSSAFKDLLKDIKKFHKEKILKEKEPQEEKSYFVEGTYIHSLILEPHTIADEFAFFPGNRKQGKEWETFKEQNEGKYILSKPQKMRCDAYFESYKKRKIAQDLISGGEPEHTICGTFHEVKVKARCDYINVEKGYIVDVKTSALPVDVDTFKMTMATYMYELSAALYCQIAEMHYDKPFDFYFVALSKKDLTCEVFKLSQENMEKGKRKLMKAISKYKKALRTGNWSDNIEKETINSDYEILEV